jgi:hypothetical protein
MADLRVPVMAVQTTYSNEKRERQLMSTGQSTSYLDMLRTRVPSIRIEIIENTGHFPRTPRHQTVAIDLRGHGTSPGINVRDIIIIDGGDIFGDGVNVAARLRSP